MSVGATPSLNFIGDTVGDTPPHSMSEMRGIRFASGNSPTSGAISLSDFRNQVLTRDAIEEAKITASDGQSGDNFGHSASISGDGLYAIVGAYQEDSGSENAGAAYIFKRTNSSWAEQAKIQGSLRQEFDTFGSSVSISGDGSYAIVGAPSEDGLYVNTGSAYVFKRTNSSWAQQAKLTASDGQLNDFFGGSVAISGDGLYAIVGANQEDPFFGNAGSVYIFKRTNSSWAQQAKLTASDGQSRDYFGSSVSISGDGSYAAVAANVEDAGGTTDAGAVYIFKRTNSSWAQQAKLTASDRQEFDYFGRSVSISQDDGSYAIVGAQGDNADGDFAGAAYIFKRTNSSWAEQTKLTASDRQANDYFGYSVSISGDGSYAVVGALGEDTGASGAGAAYIFKRTNSSWAEDKKIQGSDKQQDDNFGRAVSITGDASRIIVGASYEATKGAAYIFNDSYYI